MHGLGAHCMDSSGAPPALSQSGLLFLMPASTSASLIVRDSTAADIDAIHAIYAHHVQHGTASFELEPPAASEMRARREAVLAQRLPYLVAELGGELVGYAYCTPYRPRPASRPPVGESGSGPPGRARPEALRVGKRWVRTRR